MMMMMMTYLLTYFQRSLPVRPKVCKRRTFADCQCGILQARCPFLSRSWQRQFTEGN